VKIPPVLNRSGFDSLTALTFGAGYLDRPLSPGDPQSGRTVVTPYYHLLEQGLNFDFIQAYHNFIPDHKRRHPAEPPGRKLRPCLRVFVHILFLIFNSFFPKVHLRRMTMRSRLRCIHDYFIHQVPPLLFKRFSTIVFANPACKTRS
jgi:hypothetical protein